MPTLVRPEAGKKIILKYDEGQQCGTLLSFSDDEFFVRVHGSTDAALSAPQDMVITRRYLVQWSQDSGAIEELEATLMSNGYLADAPPAEAYEEHRKPTPQVVAPGKLIVIEGCDGSGTSTQAAMLARRLGETKSVVGHEPTGGSIGSIIRQALRHEQEFTWDAMALLFAADRVDHCRRVIAPLLLGGTHVICDRYWLSSLIYQTLTAEFDELPGVERFGANRDVLQWVRTLNKRIIQPDICFVLTVGDEEAAERRKKRGGKPELFEKTELQRRVAEAYECPANYAEYPFVLVDGGRSASEVHASIWSYLRQQGIGHP